MMPPAACRVLGVSRKAQAWASYRQLRLRRTVSATEMLSFLSFNKLATSATTSRTESGGNCDDAMSLRLSFERRVK